MGLLDDAIREHLELKRLRGADPGEVARLEHEALGPIRESRSAPMEGEQENAPELIAESAEVVEEQEPALAEPMESAGARQETAEIDMQLYIDDVDPESGVDGEHHGENGADTADPTDVAVEDVLEETPEFLQETPEHERLWFEQQPPRDFDFDK